MGSNTVFSSSRMFEKISTCNTYKTVSVKLFKSIPTILTCRSQCSKCLIGMAIAYPHEHGHTHGFWA